jgi:hypothetical protein
VFKKTHATVGHLTQSQRWRRFSQRHWPLQPFFSGDVRASLAVPSFNENFDTASGRLKYTDLDILLKEAVKAES